MQTTEIHHRVGDPATLPTVGSFAPGMWGWVHPHFLEDLGPGHCAVLGFVLPWMWQLKERRAGDGAERQPSLC